MVSSSFDIVAHTVGDSVALLSRVSGAIVLSNELGLHILAALRKGHDPEKAAQDLAEHPNDYPEALAAIQTILARWQNAGLLASDPPGFPDPVDFRVTNAKTMQFTGMGGDVACRISDPVLAEQIETVLAEMAGFSQDAPRVIEAISAGDGFGIFRDRQAVSGQIVLDAARFVLLRETAEHLCGWNEVAAVFHAGAVAQNEQALVLCGDSGQGKSTLTFGLVAAGCAYLADDHVPLHRNGRDVMAFPTAAGVKEGSWELPEIRALQERYGLIPHSPREGVRYLPLHQANAPEPGTRHSVRALIFPEYRPDADFEMDQITPEQALILALQAGSRLSASHSGDIAPLADLLNHVPAYRLRYCATEQSVPACLDLLNSPLP